MMKSLYAALITATALSLPLGASADVLLIDTIKQGSSVAHPARGLRMNAVKQRYGKPTREVPAVGQPPISRWEYPGYTVYFEHDIVLETVMHR